MLLQHSGIYLAVRIVPALVSFASLAIYTRILSPADYGVYVLVLAGVSLVKALGVSWLEMAVLRLLPAYRDRPQELLSTALGLFLITSTVSGILAIAAAAFWPDPVVSRLILVGIPLLWAHSWFELNLGLCQAKLLPARYGLLVCARSVVSLGLGSFLVLWGLGGYGPIMGLCAGSTVGGLMVVAWEWRGIRPRIHRDVARTLFTYGLPLTGTVALAFVLDTTDRFMITAFLGEAAVGAYAAAFDLTAQSLSVLLMTVNLAAYPLAIQAFETKGQAAAAQQIRMNGSLLLAVGLPAAMGLVTLSQAIAGVLLGPEFRAEGVKILPWVALAILVAGLRSYLFDYAFQLTRRTGLLMWGPGAAALCNLPLNFVLIPRYGPQGAAWATLAAYVVALVVCILAGRRIMPIRLDWGQAGRIAISTAAMTLFLLWLPLPRTAAGLALGVTSGMLVYALAMVATNGIGVRTYLRDAIGRLRFAGAQQAPRDP